MKKLLIVAALVCALWPGLSSAQNAITQNGPVLQNSPLMFRGDHHVSQGATVAGGAAGHIVTTGDAVVGGRCDYSAPTDDPNGYYFTCLDAANNAIRVGGTKLPAQNMTIEINGTRYTFPGSVAVVGSDTAVGSNVGLKSVPGATGKRTVRLGFSSPGDGGMATYNWSGSNCTAADDGAQVQPSTTGCWVVDFSGMKPVPEVWGATGNGVSNDTAAVNAALTYVALSGGNLYGRSGSSYGINAMITIKSDTCFIGAGMDKSKIKLLSTVAVVVNMESRSCMEDMYIDATPQVASGVVIQLGTGAGNHREKLRRVYTQHGCTALDINGSSHEVDHSFFFEMDPSANCGGIRIGHNTTGGTTVGLKLSSTITACTPGSPANFNMKMEDSGGSFIGPGVDQVNCSYGTIIKPANAQEVSYTFCTASAMGDSNFYTGMLMDTAGTTGKVRGNLFDGCWTSGSPGGQGVVIQNIGGGLISGNTFLGHRAYSNFTNAIEIKTPVSGTIEDTQFNGLRVCNTQYGADVLLGNNTSLVVQNSRIGKQCDGQQAGGTVGLLYGIGLGTGTTLTATGNDFTYSGGELWSPISGVPTGSSDVNDNRGISTTTGPTYASAATISLDLVAPVYHLTGTTTITAILRGWSGEKICLISDNGVINFGNAGNIAAAVATSGAGGMVCGHYDPTITKWYLH